VVVLYTAVPCTSAGLQLKLSLFEVEGLIFARTWAYQVRVLQFACCTPICVALQSARTGLAWLIYHSASDIAAPLSKQHCNFPCSKDASQVALVIWCDLSYCGANNNPQSSSTPVTIRLGICLKAFTIYLRICLRSLVVWCDPLDFRRPLRLGRGRFVMNRVAQPCTYTPYSLALQHTFHLNVVYVYCFQHP